MIAGNQYFGRPLRRPKNLGASFGKKTENEGLRGVLNTTPRQQEALDHRQEAPVRRCRLLSGRHGADCRAEGS